MMKQVPTLLRQFARGSARVPTARALSAVPMEISEASNPRIVLEARAAADPVPELFRFDAEGSVPELRDGTCLVRNRFISVDPAMKGWIARAQNYASVPTGATMAAFGAGEVVASALDGVRPGDLVVGRTGVQRYGVADPAEPLFRVLDPRPGSVDFPTAETPLSASLGALGINGLTAALALDALPATTLGPGKTVLISTAAGAVGSAAGQIARRSGARIVGVAGGAAKAAACASRFGYDACVDYKACSDADALAAALRGACPDGVDAFVDMVGGQLLDIVLADLLNVGGSVQVVGTAGTSSWDPAPLGPRAERSILVKRAEVKGFLVFDHARRFPETLARLSKMIAAGELTHEEDVRPGLESFPGALADLYRGSNAGKVLIEV
jgi:NADPH-dependent curcumin reductase CurA